jgi:hypothetical protein
MRIASRVFSPVVIAAAVGLAAAQDVGPRWMLGVEVKPVNTQNGPGVEVVSVVPDSPAQGAGIEPRDVILSINGQATPGLDELLAALAGSGGRASVTVIDCNTGQVATTPPIPLAQLPPANDPRPPQGAARPNNQGCSVRAFAATTGIQQAQLMRSLNEPALDEAFRNDLNLVSDRFRARPRFYFFQDGNAANAFSTPEVLGDPGDYPPDSAPFGTIVMGVTMLGQELNEPGQHYSIAAILAHEWGHTIQFRRNCGFQGKARELHADYMSGWHIRHIKDAFDQNLDETQVFGRVYKHGDGDRDGGFTSPDAHGTNGERLRAFLGGFESKAGDVDAAYAQGLQFIARELR